MDHYLLCLCAAPPRALVAFVAKETYKRECMHARARAHTHTHTHAHHIHTQGATINNYGTKPSEELLLGYGFLLPNNEADYFHVSIGHSGQIGRAHV